MPSKGKRLDKDTIVKAFEIMGRYLKDRDVVGEVAIYGGTAILFQFEWRRSTEDVDAVIRTPESEIQVKLAAGYAGTVLDLPDDWLNNDVGGFTPDEEGDDFFLPLGSYPSGETPSLMVALAKPEYLCAMKLAALKRPNVGDKDFDDALRLALEAGIGTAEELQRLYKAFFPNDELDPMAAERLPELVARFQGSQP